MSLEARIRQSFTVAIDEARGKLETELQATLAAAQEDAARERDAAVSETRQAVEAELRQAFDAQSAQQSAEHDAAVQQLRHSAEATLAQARQEAETQLVAARADAERGQIEMGRLLQQAESHGAALRASEYSRQQAVEARAGGARRMLDGVKALDAASTLSEVLDALTAAAAAESGRAAMLVVKGDRLIGWRTAGFGELDAQPRSIEASTSDADALARAVATTRVVVTGSGPTSNIPNFANATAAGGGIAVPLLVGGRAVAVIYADGLDQTGDQSPSQAAIDVLVRHAGRCLEALTVQRAAQARSSAVRVSTPA